MSDTADRYPPGARNLAGMRRGIVILVLLAACSTSTSASQPSVSDSTTPRAPAAQTTDDSTATSVAQPPIPDSVPTEPTTTTIVAEASPTDADPAASPDGAPARVAVIGCSQTRDAIFGYNDVRSDLRFGASEDAQYLGGASIEVWAEPRNRKWDTFESLVGPDNDGLLVQICWHAQRSVGADLAMVQDIMERATQMIGHDVPVFVMGLNDWDPRSLCPRGDYPASAALADEVAAAGLAIRVPDLGPLDPTQTDDGCHGNRDGNRLMGEQLAEFFG